MPERPIAEPASIIWQKVSMIFAGVAVVLALISSVDLAGAIWNRLWAGHWSFYSIGQLTSSAGFQMNGTLANWPAALLGFFPIMFLMDSHSQPPPTQKSLPSEKEKRPVQWKRIFAGWLWPRQPKETTTVAIRLGRVIHWLTISIACVALVIGVAIGWDSVSMAARSTEAARAWDAAHPSGQPDPSNFLDYRPYPSESYFGAALLGGLIAALAIALAGRGTRYILAGE